MALPVPGASKDRWGDQLNDFLRVAHNEDGTLKDVAFESDLLSLVATVDQVETDVSVLDTVAARLREKVFYAADYASVSDAITAANAAGGGVVELGAGLFEIPQVTLRDDVDLRGRGKNLTIIQPDNTVATALLIGTSGTTTTDVTISDLTIFGDYSGSGPNISAIQVTNGNRITVERCGILDFGGAGVLFQGFGASGGTPNSLVQDCYLDGIGLADGSTGFGIWFKDASSNGTARRNTLVNIMGGMGIGGSGSGGTGYPLNLGISDNNITMLPSTTGFEAIGVQAECLYTRIINNTITDSQDNGISCSAGYSTVVGNTVNGCLNHGIYTQGPHTVITGNTVRNPGQEYPTTSGQYGGITATTTSYCVIVGNSILDELGNMFYGVKLTSSAGYNTVGLNEVTGWISAEVGESDGTDTIITGGISLARLSIPIASGAVVFDASKGRTNGVSLTENVTTASIIGATRGADIRINWRQDATGGRTYVWPSNCRFAGGAAPTASTTAFWVDSVTFEYDGTYWYEVSRSMAMR